MRYFGGKARTCKQIANVINSAIQKKKFSTYIEPFCGGLWVTQYVKHFKRQIYDINPFLIDCYKAIQNGWVPPDTIDSTLYQQALKNEVEPHLRGFIGFGCSFAGKWLGDYARSNERNYCLNAKNSLMKKFKNLDNCIFQCQDYRLLEPTDAIIYCDPPYADTTKYDYIGNFDSVEFWQIMEKWSKNNTVIISEYKAPDNWKCIYEIYTKTDIRNKNNQKEPRIEKLFTI